MKTVKKVTRYMSDAAREGKEAMTSYYRASSGRGKAAIKMASKINSQSPTGVGIKAHKKNTDEIYKRLKKSPASATRYVESESIKAKNYK